MNTYAKADSSTVEKVLQVKEFLDAARAAWLNEEGFHDTAGEEVAAINALVEMVVVLVGIPKQENSLKWRDMIYLHIKNGEKETHRVLVEKFKDKVSSG